MNRINLYYGKVSHFRFQYNTYGEAYSIWQGFKTHPNELSARP